MNTNDTTTPNAARSLTPALAAIRAFAWGEVFVLIPMHAFWMLFRSTPFVAENTSSALVAATPLILLAIVGLASLSPRFRAALVSAEWLFHLTAALGMLLLLVYITVRDPFSPGMPITWPLCLWSIVMAFTALSNFALHERARALAGPDSRTPWVAGIVIAVAMWGVLIGLGAGMAWAPYFWTASLVFHAAMAPISRRIAPSTLAPPKPATSAAALFESLFVVSFMLAAVLRVVFTFNLVGRAELKYLEFVNLAAHPVFLAGLAAGVLATRLRIGFVAHAIVAGVVLFGPEPEVWPCALAIGYALPVLFACSCRQGPVAYALTLPAVTVVFALGMLGFMVAGVVVVFEMGAAFTAMLTGRIRILAPILYVVWLAAAALARWATVESHSFTSSEAPDATPSCRFSALAYVKCWLLILVSVAYFVVTAMWPPVTFHRDDRVEVGVTSGVCHAGYSKSDEEYAKLHDLGVQIMRIDFHWHRVQSDADTWDFTRFDTYVDAAEKHGVNVLGLLVFDNNAVETNQKGKETDHYLAPEDLPKYLEYIRRTVARYKGRVYAWELWNEPDIPRFWDGPIEELYELVARAAETVRETDPDALLLGPAATSPLGPHLPPVVEELHARGALEHVDHPTMHTYISDPRAYYGEYYRIRNAAAKFGHPGSVWITELGGPDGGVYPWRGSRDHLAVHAMKSYTIATCVGIEKLIWYCYHDSDPNSLREKPLNSEGFFGLTNRDDSWKPAAYAFSLFSKHCSNSTIRTDLVNVCGGLAARQLRTALYRRDNGDSALVLWFEPGLRPGAHARVTLDLGELAEPATTHSITGNDPKPLLDPVIDVTETPTFITFTAPDPETPIQLCVASSPADTAWLVLALVLVVAAAWIAVRIMPRGDS